MRRSGRVLLLATGMLLVVACASQDPAVTAAASETQEDQVAEPASPTPTAVVEANDDAVTATDPAESDEAVSARDQDEQDAMTSSDAESTPLEDLAATQDPQPDVTPEPTLVPAVADQECVRLTDFAIEAENLSWFIVNDNVMGGRSSGGPTFADSAMVFEGEINTDGGGFSSVRVPLGSNTLTGFTELLVRARTDGRAYKLTLEDSLQTRDRRVSQQAALDFAATTDWQTGRVAFAELEPRIFGRAVQSDAFRPDLATQLGIMISDGVDGPFRIEVDWIDACR